mgnify:CR=1 FL=1
MRDRVAEIYGSSFEDWLRVYFDYDPDLIEDLKDTIPKRARRWDPEDRCWLILPSQKRALTHLLAEHGHTVKSFERNAPAGGTPRPSPSPNFDPIEALLREIPTEMRAKVYRQLAIALHPDNGGDTELMKRLNVIWDKLGRK